MVGNLLPTAYERVSCGADRQSWFYHKFLQLEVIHKVAPEYGYKRHSN